MTTQREHITRLINTLQRRLNELEIDQAQLGFNAPPHLAIEISDTRAEIDKQQAAINALELVDTLTDATPTSKILDRRAESNYDHRLNVMVATVMATVQEVASVKKLVTDETTAINDKLDNGIADIRLLIYRIVVGAVLAFTVWSFLLIAFLRMGWI